VPLLLDSFRLDHDAVPLHQAGAQHSQSPIDALMGGDEVTLKPPLSGRCSILNTFEKLTNEDTAKFNLGQTTKHKLPPRRKAACVSQLLVNRGRPDGGRGPYLGRGHGPS
jgi:hypothetical protein